MDLGRRTSHHAPLLVLVSLEQRIVVFDSGKVDLSVACTGDADNATAFRRRAELGCEERRQKEMSDLHRFHREPAPPNTKHLRDVYVNSRGS